MRTLVTGVAGFIGSTLARRLLADGHDVVGVDALTDYYDPRLKRENLRGIEHPRLRLVEADLNAVDLPALLADVEVVYHQAGQPGVRKSWGTDFDGYLQGNVGTTQKLLEAALRAPHLSRFVYASSSSVYGNALRYPTQESDLPRPLSPYGVTKLAAEHLCTLYAQNYGLPDGVAALLHRLRPAAAARHGLHQLLHSGPGRRADPGCSAPATRSATSPTSTTSSRPTCA